MKKNKVRKVMMILCLIVILVMVFAQLALARAGGGGGGGGGGSSRGGGGIIGIILAPFLLIYSAILTAKLNQKNREARMLLARISENERSWDLSKIKNDIEIAYFKVQEAWMKRDQTIAKDYMSKRLFSKHKAQTDFMIEQHRKNILQNINLIESRIVQVADYKDDSKDMMWVYIKGSMIDYIINDQTNKVISGSPNEAEQFTELWKFIRGPEGWVLDEIDQTVTLDDFKRMQSFSEASKQRLKGSLVREETLGREYKK